MRRRSTLLFTIFALIVSMFACTPEELTPSQLVDGEFARIQSLIPTEFSSDLLLPQAEEDFIVTYRKGGTMLSDRILEHRSFEEDVLVSLVVTIWYDDTKTSYQIDLWERANDGTVEPPDPDPDPDVLTFQGLLDYLNETIPDPIVSNVTLPTNWHDVYLTYTQTCGDIVRGRLVYSFPTTNQTCQLTYTATLDGQTNSLSIQRTISSVNALPRLPRIDIVTVNNATIDSKDEYVDATITVTTYDGIPYPEVSDDTIQIRRRGNSTFWMPKHSYKIKFDEQTRLLSHYAERDWVLLANFTDQSLIRNALAFSLSDRMRMRFSPSVTFVDVYLNGEYQGNYLLTDEIEVTGDRIDIEENVPDIDTGYLIEYDFTQYGYGLGNTGDNYFLIDGIPFVVHSPDHTDDHYRPEHLTYIADYMNDLFTILENKEDYTDMIDEASFIDWFIINEVFKNVDSGYSSIFFYKHKGGKLYMGPVWDFDLSTGNPGHLQADLRVPEGWYTNRGDKNILFYHLMQYPEFQTALKERWNEIYEPILLPTLDEVWMYADSITWSQYQNFQRWDIIGKNEEWYTAPEILALTTFNEQVWFLYDYLDVRLEWLNDAINELP